MLLVGGSPADAGIDPAASLGVRLPVTAPPLTPGSTGAALLRVEPRAQGSPADAGIDPVRGRFAGTWRGRLPR